MDSHSWSYLKSHSTLTRTLGFRKRQQVARSSLGLWASAGPLLNNTPSELEAREYLMVDIFNRTTWIIPLLIPCGISRAQSQIMVREPIRVIYEHPGSSTSILMCLSSNKVISPMALTAYPLHTVREIHFHHSQYSILLSFLQKLVAGSSARQIH